MAETSVGHNVYRPSMGLLLPYTPPLSTPVFLLMLGADIWPYWASGFIVQAKESRTERKLFPGISISRLGSSGSSVHGLHKEINKPI